MKKRNFRLRLLPVIAFTALIFLIVKADKYSFRLPDTSNLPFDDWAEVWDVFCGVKSSAIFAVTIWAVVTMAYLLISGKVRVKKTILYLPMAVYTVCVIVSCTVSDFKYIAWNGSVARFEGTRTIICYMFMLFYIINVVDELRDAIIILSSVMAGVFVACIVGITQLAKHDFLLTDIAKRIVTGGGNFSLEGRFEAGQVYQTVANMDYVGMYLSLVVPLLLTILYVCFSRNSRQKLLMLGISDNKRIVMAIATLVLLVMIAVNIYGAGSVGGWIGICTGIAILLITTVSRKWLKAVLAVVFVTGAIVLLNSAYADSADTHKQIEYIETGIDYIRLSLNGNELDIIYDRYDNQYELVDGQGNSVPTFWFAEEEGRYQVDDPRFAGEITLVPLKDQNGTPCVVVDVKDEEFGFTFYEDGAKYLNPFGNEVELGVIDSVGFEGHLIAGSGRGYIWSRTIPLLKKHLLMGTGADTFMLVFPQDDYAGKYSSGSPLQVTCDKPHNMYLGMAVGTGIISLLAFVSIIAISLLRVFKSDEISIYAKSLVAGIIGFLVVGLFNDSSVCVMPMFYGLLGIVTALSGKKEG